MARAFSRFTPNRDGRISVVVIQWPPVSAKWTGRYNGLTVAINDGGGRAAGPQLARLLVERQPVPQPEAHHVLGHVVHLDVHVVARVDG